MGRLEAALRARRDGGGRCFVPYVTGGLPGVDGDLLRALAAVGADAIEVGIPFSDPVMDGGVIQEASRIALEAGTTPDGVLAAVAGAEVDAPVAVMTYANPVFNRGWEGFVADVRGAGAAGLIVPDLPVDEADELLGHSEASGLDLVQLAAPGTGPERWARVAASARGFVYCVSTYGVTGVRERLAGTARDVVEGLRGLTDLPLLVGVGVGSPEAASEACAFADGVVVGSALMERLVAGDREGALALARAFREAVPRGP
jgi:tryptophan synthase alpha chain